jgi:hypothetical protein
MKEFKRIVLGILCGGGVGYLLVGLLKTMGVEADLRFLLPVFAIIFVNNRNNIFK